MVPGLHQARRLRGVYVLCAAICLESGLATSAATAGGVGTESEEEALQVVTSATRFRDPVRDVPLAITALDGEGLAQIGIHSVRSALDNVVGVTTGPGGDDGSAGLSLGLLGRRELDDFLLVVDGVPLGGAFVPQFAALSLENIDRIEVLRGTAPVYFGTTAFAGTLSIDHPEAGTAANSLDASVGLRGAYRTSGAFSGALGSWQQSLLWDRGEDRFEDPRAGWQRTHVLWRGAKGGPDGRWKVDVEWTDLSDRPMSPTPFDGSTALLPIDFNQNPTEAGIKRTLSKVMVSYEGMIAGLPWTAMGSWMQTHYAALQGFLADIPPLGDAAEATAFAQRRRIQDGFFDTHITAEGDGPLALTTGINVLFGRLATDNSLYNYELAPEGESFGLASPLLPQGENLLRDRRLLVGLYAQTRWRISPALLLLAGLRYNDLQERQQVVSADDTVDERQHLRRLSGSVGLNYSAPRLAKDAVALSYYASVGSTFQPPQIDLGPDPPAGPLLAPETLTGVVAGLRVQASDVWSLETAVHQIHVDHRSVALLVGGLPQLSAAGVQNVRGLELEGHWRAASSSPLRLSLEYAHNDARYGHFPFLTGTATVDLNGSRIELVPGHVGGMTLDWLPPLGWQASVTVKYVGNRGVQAGSDAQFGGYALLGGYLGYRFRGYSIGLRADNVTNRRDPAVMSEFGEGQIYRLEGARAFLGITFAASK